MAEVTVTELFEKMSTLWEDLADNHMAFIEKGNKTAGKRARIAAGEIKKLVTAYRKASVTEAKAD